MQSVIAGRGPAWGLSAWETDIFTEMVKKKKKKKKLKYSEQGGHS